MLILDDLLLFPFRRLLWIFQEIHKAAQQGLVDEEEAGRDAEHAAQRRENDRLDQKLAADVAPAGAQRPPPAAPPPPRHAPERPPASAPRRR